MSQTKYKLPAELRDECVRIVRNYKWRLTQYQEARYDIIHNSRGAGVVTVKEQTDVNEDGKPIYTEYGVMPTRSGKVSDEPFDKAAELEKLDESPNARLIWAVDQATVTIGNDCAEEQRQILRIAIWDSCVLGRNFKLQQYDVACGRDNFYERRRRFLWHIAKNMGFI